MVLDEKIALVTGGAKRVGREIALGLARKGCHILLHCHTSGSEADQTRRDIEALGVSCLVYRADLAESGQIHQMTGKIFRKTKNVDILVNSASVFYKTPLEAVKELDWDRVMDTNLKGPFVLAHILGSHMRREGGGKIINIADWSGLRPYKDHVPYCTSKGGLITLTKALARDLAPKVLVNAVAPGPVLLPPNFPKEEKEAIIEKTPLGRLGTPTDVASAVIFLLENDFINGFVLVVDGGRSIV